MKSKKKYTAPNLTVVTFKAERGYASSGQDFFNMIIPYFSSETMMSSSQESWINDSENSFGSSW